MKSRLLIEPFMSVLINNYKMGFVWIIVPLVLIFAFVTPYSFADFHIDEAVLTWSQANYRVTNGTGIITIIVNDNDKNEIPFFAEKVKVFVYSDSFLEGITLELYETEKNSGKFERTLSFSDSRSAPNILLAREGDTAIAVYTDEPLSPDYQDQTIEFTATTLIGSTGPPLERAPASHARIVDSLGNTIDSPAVGQQVQITSDVANGQNQEQKFAYIVMIQDETNTAVSLAWIDGVLNPESSFSPSASWIPQDEGDYIATMFVWESIDNPTALSPPISIDFTVISENEQRTRQYESGNYQEMFMFVIPQNEFESFTDFDLRLLYYYKVNHQELSSLPRLSLLVNMTEDFAHVPISNLALRINNEQIKQYELFFEQKCKEQRPYVTTDDCLQTDFTFEYDEKWYYVYPKLAPHHGAIEDTTNTWDPEYFTRHEN